MERAKIGDDLFRVVCVTFFCDASGDQQIATSRGEWTAAQIKSSVIEDSEKYGKCGDYGQRYFHKDGSAVLEVIYCGMSTQPLRVHVPSAYRRSDDVGCPTEDSDACRKQLAKLFDVRCPSVPQAEFTRNRKQAR
jgi:hypothetical protein